MICILFYQYAKWGLFALSLTLYILDTHLLVRNYKLSKEMNKDTIMKILFEAIKVSRKSFFEYGICLIISMGLFFTELFFVGQESTLYFPLVTGYVLLMLEMYNGVLFWKGFLKSKEMMSSIRGGAVFDEISVGDDDPETLEEAYEIEREFDMETDQRFLAQREKEEEEKRKKEQLEKEELNKKDEIS